MKRYEFEQAVYDPGNELTAAQIGVLLWYAHHKNWNKDGLAWGSAETIGRDMRVNPRTVERARPLLEERGWLVDTGECASSGKGRPVRKYDLALPDFSDNESDFPGNQTDFSDIETDFPDTMSEEQVSEQVQKQDREQVTTTGTPVVPDKAEVSEGVDSSSNYEDAHPDLANVGSRDAAQPRKREPLNWDTNWEELYENKLKEKAQ